MTSPSSKHQRRRETFGPLLSLAFMVLCPERPVLPAFGQLKHSVPKFVRGVARFGVEMGMAWAKSGNRSVVGIFSPLLPGYLLAPQASAGGTFVLCCRSMLSYCGHGYLGHRSACHPRDGYTPSPVFCQLLTTLELEVLTVAVALAFHSPLSLVFFEGSRQATTL